MQPPAYVPPQGHFASPFMPQQAGASHPIYYSPPASGNLGPQQQYVLLPQAANQPPVLVPITSGAQPVVMSAPLFASGQLQPGQFVLVPNQSAQSMPSQVQVMQQQEGLSSLFSVELPPQAPRQHQSGLACSPSTSCTNREMMKSIESVKSVKSTSSNNKSVNSDSVCRHFLEGKCNRRKCRFKHQTPSSSTTDMKDVPPPASPEAKAALAASATTAMSSDTQQPPPPAAAKVLSSTADE